MCSRYTGDRPTPRHGGVKQFRLRRWAVKGCMVGAVSDDAVADDAAARHVRVLRRAATAAAVVSAAVFVTYGALLRTLTATTDDGELLIVRRSGRGLLPGGRGRVRGVVR